MTFIARLIALVHLALALPHLAGAQAPPNQSRHAAERAELLRLHQSDRDAHFKTDVALLQQRSPETMLSVSNGQVRRTTKDAQRAMFTAYFAGARYDAWDDLEEPIIRISDDASMAWMIVRLRVRRVQKDAQGVERDQSFVYAGIMTYEKRDGRWMKVANVSTVEPTAPGASR